MRIGEFAEICKVPISVLRHYDKEGLLVPDFIDRFTGYRYYSGAQIAVFQKITALKIAGFSLKEIKEILYKTKETQDLQNMFEQKKSDLNQKMANLNSAEKMMLGVGNMKKSYFIQTGSGLEMRSGPLRNPLVPNEFEQACKQLEQDAYEQDCQRISGFKTFGGQDSAEIQIGIDVVPLNAKIKELNEDINMPFEMMKRSLANGG